MFMLILLALMIGALVLNSIRWLKEEGSYWLRIMIILLIVGIILTITSIFWVNKIILYIIFAIVIGVLITSIGSIIGKPIDLMGILSVVVAAILALVMLYPLLSKNTMWTIGKARQFWSESRDKWRAMMSPRQQTISDNLLGSGMNNEIVEGVVSAQSLPRMQEDENISITSQTFGTMNNQEMSYENFEIDRDEYGREIDNILKEETAPVIESVVNAVSREEPVISENEEGELEEFFDVVETPPVVQYSADGRLTQLTVD